MDEWGFHQLVSDWSLKKHSPNWTGASRQTHGRRSEVRFFFGKTLVFFLVLVRQYLNLLKMLQNMFLLDFRIISQEVNMVIGRFVDIISSSKLISSIFYLLRTGRDWLLPAD